MKNEAIWVSLCSFFLTVFFCFFSGEIGLTIRSLPDAKKTTKKKQESLKPVTQIIKNSSSQISQEYIKWKIRGEEAEKNKNLANAIRFYSWALSFHHNLNLEKHVAKLISNTENKNNKLLSNNKIWKRALFLENNNQHKKALILYEKLQKRNAYPHKLPKRIAYCRQKLQKNKQFKNMFLLAKQLEWQGKFRDALNIYEKLIVHEPKKAKQKIKAIEKIKKYHEKVEKKVQELIEEKRHIYAYRYISHPSLNKNYFKNNTQYLKEKILEKMVRVPKGNFIFGDDNHEDESPKTTEYLDSFYIYKYEVTNEDYYNYVKITNAQSPKYWRNASPKKEILKHPVVEVSWKNAIKYCQWLGVRLPTEKEWEKAARGKDGNMYPWGNLFKKNRANTQEEKIRHVTNVGQFSSGKSLYGCYDMIGNVSEWTSDDYSSYENNVHFLPIRPGYKVVRGGSMHYKGSMLRCSKRYSQKPNVKLLSIGFRYVIDAKKLGIK